MIKNKAKIYMIFSLIVLVIAVIVSGTYAYYVWTTSDSDTTKIVAGIGAATVTFNKGSDISANLRPVSDKSKGIIKDISVKADTEGLVFNMYLDITSIDTDLKDESFRYELYKGDTKVKEGNFSDSYLTSNTVTCSKNNTNHIVLLTNESISTSKTSYTLYIWIDGENYTNPNTMMNKTFSFKLHADGEGAVLIKTAAQTIKELYINAEKKTVTNNNINYNIAPSVRLMSDRLGGTTADVEGGNIRYYGNSQSEIVPGWQSDRTSILANQTFGNAFTSESNCSSMLTALTTCSANYSALGFSSASECEAGLPTLLKSMANVSTVSELITEYCINDTYPLNNYIYFNCSDYSNQSSSTCETWRIIGVFDNKVKIMRNSTIGKLAWDYDKNDNSSLTTYDNNWHTATLQKLLNNSYYNGTGAITYYNPNSANNSVSLNMNNIGIKNTATRNMISETNWYLGGWNTSGIYSNQIYRYERGTQKCSSCTYETIWKGNIALPYPSDYSYSSDFSICTSNILNYTNNVCLGTNWMYPIMSTDGTQSSWLLTPDSGDSHAAWNVHSAGVVYDGYATSYDSGVAPVLYLSSELGIESGDGTSDNPYKLSA